MSRGLTGAVVLFLALALLSACATSKPEKAWVRTDGRKILDDPALLKKGETDIALCNANLDSGAVDEGARKCMGLKGCPRTTGPLVPSSKCVVSCGSDDDFKIKFCGRAV